MGSKPFAQGPGSNHGIGLRPFVCCITLRGPGVNPGAHQRYREGCPDGAPAAVSAGRKPPLRKSAAPGRRTGSASARGRLRKLPTWQRERLGGVWIAATTSPARGRRRCGRCRWNAAQPAGRNAPLRGSRKPDEGGSARGKGRQGVRLAGRAAGAKSAARRQQHRPRTPAPPGRTRPRPRSTTWRPSGLNASGRREEPVLTPAGPENQSYEPAP
jgi:hypothetical protein